MNKKQKLEAEIYAIEQRINTAYEKLEQNIGNETVLIVLIRTLQRSIGVRREQIQALK